ncbi:ATP-binding protein [Desulfobacterales bacterium HSG17]|nr:ATP-binding protein [Desulfobacterales bacterium HSG17]
MHQQDIRETEKRYQAVLEAAQVVLWDWFPDEGRLVIDSIFWEQLGYNPATIDPRLDTFLALIPADDRSKIQENLSALYHRQTKKIVLELRLKSKIGDFHWFILKAGWIESTGSDSRIIGVLLDISTQKETQNLLYQREQQLFQAQKLESLGTLVAGVAHEINNPINLITLNVPLFKEIWMDALPIVRQALGAHQDQKIGGLPFNYLDKKMDTLLSDMGLAADRIVQIVAGLKNFARQQDVLAKKSVNLNQSVHNALQLAKSTIHKQNIELNLKLSEKLPEIKANDVAIEQIIMNLVVNACQAISPHSGQITIETGTSDDENNVVLQVEDTGCGIIPEIAERIFDPFVTSRQNSGGTGLGLSVTYNLVKNHDGNIRFESKKEEGTRFTVDFPVTPPKASIKILIADDEPSIRRLLIHAFRNMPHYIIEEAENGVEAMIKIGRFHPDLLILDFRMPQMDGLEVCRTLMRSPDLADIRVLIISGHTDTPEFNEIKDLGFTDILEKPVSIKHFTNTIEKLTMSLKE